MHCEYQHLMVVNDQFHVPAVLLLWSLWRSLIGGEMGLVVKR